MPMFVERKAAGEALAEQLLTYQDRADVAILALPRGGVPVAYEIAKVLHAPLDVLIVRKLGVPGQEELAMGAIASGGARVINRDVVRDMAISERAIEAAIELKQQELLRRERNYRNGRPPIEVKDRIVIVVDDGIATGATMRAAVAALKQLHPSRIIVAVPTSSVDASIKLHQEADEVVCLATPEPYFSVGNWYQDFSQTSDAEVRALLESHELQTAS